ncbi:MAG: STAS domain-containing protein [Planctomycetales bacterium]
MYTASGIYRIRQTGPRTIVGFDEAEVPNHFYHAECRDDLVRLVAEQQCRTLVLDLTHVPNLPSGLLGLIASLQKDGIEVHVCNPPECLTNAVTVAHLENEVEIEPADE